VGTAPLRVLELFLLDGCRRLGALHVIAGAARFEGSELLQLVLASATVTWAGRWGEAQNMSRKSVHQSEVHGLHLTPSFPLIFAAK